MAPRVGLLLDAEPSLDVTHLVELPSASIVSSTTIRTTSLSSGVPWSISM